ncbi:copper amine oxidase N-terminal domain-containing protein [Desertibacillus haloalkaliphilus]|uniref:copper amine oxidase N-terminal domain-containing protein n=1 Tax=Desertibacillus haloalkaliphilus TaxID=1328930 RepID=UPI001C277DF2|nr:copper amine oxidase N-terminal domain-containing protein [Desertibacillus haloalkaliphilus]MBU8906838.1 copper amine oxidase N-terminal domain-containing protein [Desertibacillus haloalkaliphilus]
MNILKLALLSLTLFCILNVSDSRAHAYSDVSIYIENDEKQYYNNEGVIENGTTLVPLRGIFESLGATVQWNQKEKTIDAAKGDTTVWLKIGSNTAKVNGKEVNISVPAQVREGRTFVPLRFISQSLGEAVHWEGSTRTVSVGGDGTGNIESSAWLGQYYNLGYTGTGMTTELYVHQKNSNAISFVSQTGYRYDPTGGQLAGYQMPWEFNEYDGEAQLTSADTASFSSGSCEATLELVDESIRVHEISEEGSCDFTGFGIYFGGEYSAYTKK